MSNNIEKAQALREFADLIESGKIPAGREKEQGLLTYIGYESGEEVRRAAEVFEAAGAVIRDSHVDDAITVAVYPSSSYFPSLEVSLYNWGGSDE